MARQSPDAPVARRTGVLVDGERLEAIWAFVRESNAHVPRLHALDRDHGFRPDEPAHPESLAFAVERL